MTGDRNVQQGSSWRVRAGAVGVALVAGVAFAPVASTITAPVAVQASVEQEAVPCDFATSGGFVVGPTGKKANFGVHGGCKNGEFWGHLNFVDHANGYHVQSVAITGYVVAPDGQQNVRDVCGVAETNNDAGEVTFVARLIDNGEPGSNDQWGLKLSNSFTVPVSNLGAAKPGGNVQIHRANNSTEQWPTTTFGVCSFDFTSGPPE